MFLTTTYKNYYIHYSSLSGIKVQSLQNSVYVNFKSDKAAKIFITKKENLEKLLGRTLNCSELYDKLDKLLKKHITKEQKC